MRTPKVAILAVVTALILPASLLAGSLPASAASSSKPAPSPSPTPSAGAGPTAASGYLGPLNEIKPTRGGPNSPCSAPPSVGASIVAIDNIPGVPNAYFQVATDGTVIEMVNGCVYQVENPISGLAAPIAGSVVTSDNTTLFLFGADGGVFVYGANRFYGSVAGRTLGGQIVSLVPTLDLGGYLLVGADGGVFNFGDAPFYGALPGHSSVSDVIGAFWFDQQYFYCMAEADGVGDCFEYNQAFTTATWVSGITTYTDPISAVVPTGDTLGWWEVDRQGVRITPMVYATAQGQLSAVPPGPIMGGSGNGDNGFRMVGADGASYNFGSLGAYWEGNGNINSELQSTYAQQIGRVMLPEGGWGTPNQWSSGLQPIWQNESGWRWNVCGGYPNGPYYPNCPYNTNIAYGIPQLLPGSKMCAEGPTCPNPTAWQTNAWTQIIAGFWYIAVNPNRYCCPLFNDPASAWQYWQTHRNYSPVA